MDSRSRQQYVFYRLASSLSQPSPFTVSPSSFFNGALNMPYSQTFMISGGTPHLYITASGTDFNNGYALPAGLTATSDGASITISGTPQQVGTFPIIFRLKDQNNCQEMRNFPLTITASATYGISGKVTNGGQGLANVAVVYSGASSGSTVTDSAGNYSFNNLAGSGNYTVTASLVGYTFAQPTVVYNNLSANYTDANFATAVTTYEGDIANRPSGDGAVNVLDLVALGRIRNSLDPMPALGAEWQRTDIAPRTSLGNGAIDDQDLTQMRNYILAVNPPTPAGGASAAATTSASKAEAADQTFVETLIDKSVSHVFSATRFSTLRVKIQRSDRRLFLPARSEPAAACWCRSRSTRPETSAPFSLRSLTIQTSSRSLRLRTPQVCRPARSLRKFRHDWQDKCRRSPTARRRVSFPNRRCRTAAA